MGVFELQTPDGKTFQVEAPSVDEALKAIESISPLGVPSPQPAQQSQMNRSPVTGRMAPPLDMRAVDTAVRGAADTLTFGLADELAAGGNTMIGRGNYDQNLAKERMRDKLDQEQRPGARLMGQVGGSVLGGLAAIKAAPTLAPKLLGLGLRTLPGKVAGSALAGGALGAAHGLGSGEGDAANRAGQAWDEAKWGAATGAVAPIIGAAVGKGIGALMGRSAAPTTGELKAGAQAAYDTAKNAKLWIDPKSFGKFGQDLAPKLNGIDPSLHPKAVAAFNRIAGASDQPLTLQDVDILRQIAGDVANSADPGERRLGVVMKSSIDDYLDKLKPADVIAGDPKAAANAILKARKQWAQYKKADMIDKAAENADLQTAATGSGGNIDNATRQKIKAILIDPKKARGFSAEEKAALMKVVQGGPIQNFLRLAGKLSPSGNGLMAALNIGAVAVNPATAVIPAVGIASKAASDALSARNLKMASELIRRGAPAPKAGSPLAAAYAQLLAQTGGQGLVANQRKPLEVTVTRPANWETVNPQRAP